MALAVPLVVARAGSMMMGVVDTWMAGHVSDDAVASLGLGNTCFWLGAVISLGMIGGQDPLVSQAVGANDQARWEEAFNATRWLALALSIPAMIGCLYATRGLIALEQPLKLMPQVEGYLSVMAFAMPLFLLYVTHASYMSSHNQTKAFAWITIGANVINVFGNLALVKGWWGFPALGVQGIAISTLLCFGFQLVCAMALLKWPLKRLWVRWAKPSLEIVREVIKLGAPISAQVSLEFLGFGVAIMFMGWISADAVAGHQVALNVASLTFTFAMGVSAAVSVRVGQAVGRRDLEGVKAAGWTAWQAGVIFAVLSGVVLILLRQPIAALYGLEGGAQAVAVKLLYIAAFFQLADIGQAIGFGILRGMGDTKMPAVFNAVSYWGFGVPLGYLGAFYWWPWRGPEVVWWGLSLALFMVASALVRRFWWQTRDAQRAFRFASALKADA
jgi:multidrug resistance protein, MATE family